MAAPTAGTAETAKKSRLVSLPSVCLCLLDRWVVIVQGRAHNTMCVPPAPNTLHYSKHKYNTQSRINHQQAPQLHPKHIISHLNHLQNDMAFSTTVFLHLSIDSYLQNPHMVAMGHQERKGHQAHAHQR